MNRFAFALATGAIAATAGARILTVTAAGPGASLAAALSEARHGDLVLVHGGVHRGNFVLDHSIALVGSDGATLDGGGQGTVLRVTAPNTIIEGLTLVHSGVELQDEDSGILLESDGNKLRDLKLDDVLYGVYFKAASENQVVGLTVRGKSQLASGARGACLHLWNSPMNVLARCDISYGRDGIYVDHSPMNTVLANVVHHTRYGLHYMSSDDNLFEGNRFENNVAGAAVMYSHKVSFRKNVFAHNRGFDSLGLLLQQCDDCTAEGNLMIGNDRGLFIEGSSRVYFRGNAFVANDAAIQLYASTMGATFTGNNFIDNISSVLLVGGRTDTRWAVDGVGNFWSDYRGIDLDGDGVGERPHELSDLYEHLIEDKPLLRIYAGSPAAASLALADTLFPVLAKKGEEDPLPATAAFPFSLPSAPPSPLPGRHAAAASLLVAALAAAVLIIGRWS